MKIIEINSVPYGSTGMIARTITNLTKEYGESYFAYSWTKKRRNNTYKDEILIGSMFEKYLSIKLEKITGFTGCFSCIGTYKLLKKIKRIDPDIVHLHNLHEGYINLNMLFKYLKKNNIKVLWTLHDCWSFTGHCPHFEMENCNKWINGCYDCPIYKTYPKSIFDNSQKMYKIKKKIFNMIDEKNLTIVTPSIWLADLIKKSYLKKYKVITINNGIDLNIFKPIKSNFRERYNCNNKYLIIGVAYNWEKRKGLDIFIKLAKELDERFKIVLVGTNNKIDKIIPSNIISIHNTTNKIELAKIYSACDLYLNPTREDTFPTVNIEALACGVPVLTFNTGGSPEIIDESCGCIVEKDNYEELKKKIININDYEFDKNKCRNRAMLYDANDKFREYIELFKNYRSE